MPHSICEDLEHPHRLQKAMNIVEALPRGQYPAKGISSKKLNYLPIEFFRNENLILDIITKKPSQKFESSGTTSLNKSHSWFSQPGINLYYENSTQHFYKKMELFFGSSAKKVHGISLVPPISEWPKSSLAQMISWISLHSPVIYADEDTILRSIRELSQGEPCWVFGTAFHFVHLFDQKRKLPLPPNSIVIETGGTKGKSRSVERSLLYQMISETFQISEKQITSEYGMSELACQAYDSSSIASSHSVSDRWFQFDDTVNLAVMPEPGVLKQTGIGLLVISDPSRIDFPWPIRSEDRVELLENKAFRLLGRARRTPLKGCSSLVENLFGANETSCADHQEGTKNEAMTKTTPTISADLHREGSPDSAKDRKDAFLKFPTYLLQSQFLDLLTEEFDNQEIASWALNDLFANYPDSNEATKLSHFFWEEAKEKVSSHCASYRWYLILPENHSIVGYYPILLAYLYGVKIAVRIPKVFSHPKSPLSLFIQLCKDHLPGFDLITLPADFRLEDPKKSFHNLFNPTESRILCYGSQETVTQIKSWYPRITQEFGESWSLSIITSQELTDSRLDWDALGKDFFSLGQLGCKSSRLLLIIANHQEDQINYEKLLFQITSFVKRHNLSSIVTRDLQLQETLEFESIRFKTKGFETRWDQVLFAFKKDLSMLGDPFQPLDLGIYATQMPGVVPMVALRPYSSISTGTQDQFYQKLFLSIYSEKHIKQIHVSPTVQMVFEQFKPELEKIVEIKRLGEGNKQVWNGWHQGNRLFLDV